MSSNILILMGNSGTGKSTLERNLVDKFPEKFHRVISHTTRTIDKKDRKEVDGVNYHFVSKEEFTDMRSNGDFIQVTKFGGNLYSSAKSEYLNEKEWSIITIAPSQVNNLMTELKKINIDNFYMIYFDISNKLVKQNLLKEGAKEADVDLRLKRDSILAQYKKADFTADLMVVDDMLNDTLPDVVVNLLDDVNN